jgi:chromosome segregation ATPase
MLKEYEILLSILKDSETRDSNLERLNSAVDIDDVQIEDLMNKVKHHIELCIQQVKVSFLDSQCQPVTEKSDNLMQDRVKELNQEKQGLLSLFSEQESSFKSNIDTNINRVDKLKETLAKALDDKKTSESKIAVLDKLNNEAQLKIKALQQQCQTLTKDLKEKLDDKDSTIDTMNSHIYEAQEEIQRLQLSNQEEKEDLQKQRRQVQIEILNVASEVKNLKDQLTIAEERLRLKEQEIYEIKENYEAQLEDIATSEGNQTEVHEQPIRLIPLFGSENKWNKPETQNKPSEQSMQVSSKHVKLQSRIHTLSDKLFEARDALQEKETEVNTLKDELKNREISQSQTYVDLKTTQDSKKLLQDELSLSNHQREQYRTSLEKMQSKYGADTMSLDKQLQDALKKIELLKAELDSKSSSSLKAGNPDMGKIIVRMLSILRKSKKVMELKDEEILKIKQELLKSFENEDK